MANGNGLLDVRVSVAPQLLLQTVVLLYLKAITNQF